AAGGWRDSCQVGAHHTAGAASGAGDRGGVIRAEPAAGGEGEGSGDGEAFENVRGDARGCPGPAFAKGQLIEVIATDLVADVEAGVSQLTENILPVLNAHAAHAAHAAERTGIVDGVGVLVVGAYRKPFGE